MRIGIGLPNLGPSANPDAVVRGAQHAEVPGYDTLWAADRLLYPVAPRNAYPGTADGSLPAYYKTVLDALGTTELIFELDLAPGIDELLASMDRLRALA